jgi:V8-like Glu-specific endopeptidase
MKKQAIVLLAVMILILLAATQVFAITDGDPDGDWHPHVVLILMEVSDTEKYRCSGTQISATIVVTAGHCTNNHPDPDFRAIRIFTESDVDNGDNNYPDGGRNSIEARRWAAHPLYETASFVFHDVGVIELAKQRRLPTYGQLPQANVLDQLATERGQQNVTFTAVGYGLQQINPVFVQSDRVRRVAFPSLIQINVPGFTGDFSLLLSNNHSTGGTCFGDSGGPNFIGDSNVIGGVTSFGINGNCAGTGGVFRLDRQNVLDFINGFIRGR